MRQMILGFHSIPNTTTGFPCDPMTRLKPIFIYRPFGVGLNTRIKSFLELGVHRISLGFFGFHWLSLGGIYRIEESVLIQLNNTFFVVFLPYKACQSVQCRRTKSHTQNTYYANKMTLNRLRLIRRG